MPRSLLLLLLLAAAPLGAAPVIYSCVDANGKRITSDRPIAECIAREQRVLSPDGSVRRVLRPNMTADESAAAEARERDAASERSARIDAQRRDRSLMQRFPNEAVHRKSREVALEDVRKAVRVSESRLALLARERKPLIDETEFFVGKPLPGKLKQQLDANDAAVEAQRALLANQQIEIGRINQRYDIELGRLRALWSGTPAGSLGPIPTTVAASGAASQPK